MPHEDPLACSRGPVDRRGERGTRVVTCAGRLTRIRSIASSHSEGEVLGRSPPSSSLNGQALAIDPYDGARNGDQLAVEVDVAPADRAGLADPATRSDHERHEVRKVPADGLVVVCEQREELTGLRYAEGLRWLLRSVRDVAGITNRVSIQGVVTGGKAAHARETVGRASLLLRRDDLPGTEVSIDRPRRQLTDTSSPSDGIT